MAIQMKALAEGINQIAEEKNISPEIIFETIEQALAAAYRKDYGDRDQEVRAELDKETGKVTVFITKEVVESDEEVNFPTIQISLADAKKLDKKAKVGDSVELTDEPEDFERRAAQTAKQVLIQRFREAERDVIFSEYKDREGTLVNGIVQRIEGGSVFIDLGKATGLLFSSEQAQGERYYPGQRTKVYLERVEQTTRGPQIVLSRSHPQMIKRLFEMEVPELEKGTVEIKAIAREAGARTKIAVASTEPGVDPVGTFVGQRGTRVQAVLNEIGEEKVDIILWNDDPKVFIANALSPAKVVAVDLGEKEKKAKVKVPEDQLSLAIGKNGQNVRLAAKLSDWNIDIIGADESGVEATAEAADAKKPKAGARSAKTKRRDIEGEMLQALAAHENTPEDVKVETKVKADIDREEKAADLENAEQGGEEAADQAKGSVTPAEAPTEDAK